MPHFEFLSENARVPELFAKVPRSGEPYIHMVQDAMRKEDCDLSLSQREVIATWVSALNGCQYCVTAHANVALELGADEDLIRDIRERREIGRADAAFRALLELARAATSAPENLSEDDIRAARDAGWSEQAILDAMVVVGAFNMINRLVLAAGLELDDERARPEARALARDGYLGAARAMSKN